MDGTYFIQEIKAVLGIGMLNVEHMLEKLVEKQIEVAEFEFEKICFFTTTPKGEKTFDEMIYEATMKSDSPCIEIIYGKRFKETDFGILKDEELDLNKLAKVKTGDDVDININMAHRIINDTFTKESKKFDIACFYALPFDISFLTNFKEDFQEEYQIFIPLANTKTL